MVKDCTLLITADTAKASADAIEFTLQNIGEPCDYTVSVSSPDLNFKSTADIHAERMEMVKGMLSLSGLNIDGNRQLMMVFEVSSGIEAIVRKNKLMEIASEFTYSVIDDNFAQSIMNDIEPPEKNIEVSSAYECAAKTYESLSFLDLIDQRSDRYFTVRRPNQVYENDEGTELELSVAFITRMHKNGHRCRLYCSPDGIFVSVSDNPDAEFPDDYLIVRLSDACKGIPFGTSCEKSRSTVNKLFRIYSSRKYLSD